MPSPMTTTEAPTPTPAMSTPYRPTDGMTNRRLSPGRRPGHDLGAVRPGRVEHGYRCVGAGTAVQGRARVAELQGGVVPVVDGVADRVAVNVRAGRHDPARGHIAGHDGKRSPVQLPGEDGELGPDAHARPQSLDADVVLADGAVTTSASRNAPSGSATSAVPVRPSEFPTGDTSFPVLSLSLRSAEGDECLHDRALVDRRERVADPVEGIRSGEEELPGQRAGLDQVHHASQHGALAGPGHDE